MQPVSPRILVSDPRKLLIQATGGDITSTALASVLFYLFRSPTAYARLSDEIRTIFLTIEAIRQGHLLNSCRSLRACLDKAMGLAPPAPGALWREVCSGGARIDAEQIPEGFDVVVCTFVTCHNLEYFLILMCLIRRGSLIKAPLLVCRRLEHPARSQKPIISHALP